MISRFTIAAALCAGMLSAATSPLTWVASNGVDDPACGSRTAPCRTYVGALPNTSAGGVIKAVDAADYAAAILLTIDKSITIDGNGVGAAHNRGIYISAGLVEIRDLSIFIPDNTIAVVVNNAQAHLSKVAFTLSSGEGIVLGGAGASLSTVTAENVSIVGGAKGIVNNGGAVVLRNSTVRSCTTGVSLFTFFNVVPTAIIEHSNLSFNKVAIDANGNSKPGGAVARVSNSILTGNQTVFTREGGGQIYTYGNNVIDENLADGVIPALVGLR